ALNVTLAKSSTANDGSNSGDNSSPARYNDNGRDNARDVEGVIGGGAADHLTGSTAANWIDGGGGNDSILAGDGTDTLIGGVNSDLAYGEGDQDFFFMQDSTVDRFLGAPGTTVAQFDTTLDVAAPPLHSAALTPLASVKTSPFVDQSLTPKQVQEFNFQYV